MKVNKPQASSAANTLEAMAAEYKAIGREFICALEVTGVQFAPKNNHALEVAALRSKLNGLGARSCNGGASISINWRSDACRACTGCPTSRTFYINLKCTRSCYFCFNPNQQDYQKHLHENRDWRGEFDELSQSGQAMTHIALTGGEPLLVFDETCKFFAEARRRWPKVHLRLYTTGDGLTSDMLDRLIACGLDEIRFSIKLDDGPKGHGDSLDAIAMSCERPIDTMIEMPVEPGTLTEMKELLLVLDRMGVAGINLLELCFPMHNWPEFERRGFFLKNPPFEIPYNYSYAGSLPVDGSELEALQLCLFAIEKKLSMGVHYCSLENKHRDQVLTQNRLASIPYASLNPETYFYECLKAFGDDARQARTALEQTGDRRWFYDTDDDSLAFHPDLLNAIGSDIALGLSTNVIEQREGRVVVRELMLEAFTR